MGRREMPARLCWKSRRKEESTGGNLDMGETIILK
jgi:hypothetical protein